MHGNAVALLACHLEFILPTNFTNVYRCAIGFSPTDNTDFIDFFLIIRFALLLCKNRSADLHRFYRCAMFFFAHKFHECLSLRDRFFSHRLHRFYRFFILIIRFALLLCKNRSVDLHRFYRCAMFFLPTNFTNITNIYCYVIVFFCRFY